MEEKNKWVSNFSTAMLMPANNRVMSIKVWGKVDRQSFPSCPLYSWDGFDFSMGTLFNTKGEENKINEIQENLKSDKLLFSWQTGKKRKCYANKQWPFRISAWNYQNINLAKAISMALTHKLNNWGYSFKGKHSSQFQQVNPITRK